MISLATLTALAACGGGGSGQSEPGAAPSPPVQGGTWPDTSPAITPDVANIAVAINTQSGMPGDSEILQAAQPNVAYSFEDNTRYIAQQTREGSELLRVSNRLGEPVWRIPLKGTGGGQLTAKGQAVAVVTYEEGIPLLTLSRDRGTSLYTFSLRNLGEVLDMQWQSPWQLLLLTTRGLLQVGPENVLAPLDWVERARGTRLAASDKRVAIWRDTSLWVSDNGGQYFYTVDTRFMNPASARIDAVAVHGWQMMVVADGRTYQTDQAGRFFDPMPAWDQATCNQPLQVNQPARLIAHPAGFYLIRETCYVRGSRTSPVSIPRVTGVKQLASLGARNWILADQGLFELDLARQSVDVAVDKLGKPILSTRQPHDLAVLGNQMALLPQGVLTADSELIWSNDMGKNVTRYKLLPAWFGLTGGFGGALDVRSVALTQSALFIGTAVGLIRVELWDGKPDFNRISRLLPDVAVNRMTGSPDGRRAYLATSQGAYQSLDGGHTLAEAIPALQAKPLRYLAEAGDYLLFEGRDLNQNLRLPDGSLSTLGFVAPYTNGRYIHAGQLQDVVVADGRPYVAMGDKLLREEAAKANFADISALYGMGGWSLSNPPQHITRLLPVAQGLLIGSDQGLMWVARRSLPIH
ncbi:hypothetical protein HNQ59_003739 [Chitinivorax tropicus]|uniref:Uncharacterized protein n=1 Tax=Chitinivorax tropicus TaxID=714531 RepID=A0A840MPQ1_9PROT|nr:hypothetical protein [Chitinivorax tropicus]